MNPTPRRMGKDIIAEVAAEHGVDVSDILSDSRKHKHAHPRMIAMRRVRAELGYSYPLIGRIFNRDHSTAIWAVRGSKKKPRQLEDAA